MPEKKIVIKLDYGRQSGDAAAAQEQPEEILEWDFKRIFVGVFLVLLLVAGLMYFWPDENAVDVDDSLHSQIPEALSKPKAVSQTEALIDRETPAKVIVDIEQIKPDKTGQEQNSIVESFPIPPVVDQNTTPVQTLTQRSESLKLADWDQSIVSRSQFTSGIINKEPVDRIDPVFFARLNQAIKIHYFVELKGLKGRFVTQQWRHNGKLVWKKRIGILGNRWRIPISKLVNRKRLGDWEVTMEDAEGKVISRQPFEVRAPLN